MGIGNTTAASALTAALTGAPPAAVTGRGTGIDDAALARKVAVIAPRARGQPARRRATARRAREGRRLRDRGAVRRRPRRGGGAHPGRASTASSPALPRCVAVRSCPAAAHLFASHRSAEPGHGRARRARARALLDLGLRLGEGTGAALAMGLVDAALRILHEMATFDTAAVTDSGA